MTVISNPTIAALTTSVTSALSPDGFTWANINQAVTIDQHGKLFVIAQRESDHACYFVYSNDDGASWTDGLSQGFITRGAWALDPTHDIVHVLWAATDTADGLIYRRYTIGRDGSNNITGFTRDMSVNLQLDVNRGTTTINDIQFPVILWLDDAVFGTYGAVVASWGIGASTGREIRSSMRVLTNTSADNTAANWKAPVTASTDAISNNPFVPYTAIASLTTSGSGQSVACARKPSGAATHALDLYWGFATGQNWNWRRGTWDAVDADWSGGLTTAATLSAQIRPGGGTTGYDQREQLITKWQYDATNDRMYIAFPTWKSSTDGDGVSFRWVNGDDTMGTLVDVHYDGVAASGSTRFPVVDISWDETLGRLVVAYVHLATKHIYVEAYDGATVDQADTLIFNAAPADIPCLGEGRWQVSGEPDRLLLVFRDFDGVDGPFTPPYTGYFGWLEWASAPLDVDLSGLPATATGTAVDPTVSLGGGGATLDLSAVPATTTGTAVDPTVSVGGSDVTVDLATLPAVAVGSARNPTVIGGGGGEAFAEATLELLRRPASEIELVIRRS